MSIIYSNNRTYMFIIALSIIFVNAFSGFCHIILICGLKLLFEHIPFLADASVLVHLPVFDL